MYACSVSHRDVSHRAQPRYDPQRGTLDLGYRGLRTFRLSDYLPGEEVMDGGERSITLTPRVHTLTGAKVGSVLRILILRHNTLTSLPSPSQLPYLTNLDVSHNQLREIPYYPRLKHLRAGENRELIFRGYQTLRSLDLSGCYQPLREPMKVESLALNRCGYTTLHLSGWQGITELSLNENGLCEWKGATELSRCTALCIDENPLTALPPLPLLHSLDASGSGITELSLPSLVYCHAEDSALIRVTCPQLQTLRGSSPSLSSLHCPLLREWIWNGKGGPLTLPALPRVEKLELTGMSGGAKVDLSHYGALRELVLQCDCQTLILPSSQESHGPEFAKLETNPLRRLEGKWKDVTLDLNWESYEALYPTLKVSKMVLYCDKNRLTSPPLSLTAEEIETFHKRMATVRPQQLDDKLHKSTLALFKSRGLIRGFRNLEEIYASRKWESLSSALDALYWGSVTVHLLCSSVSP